MKSTRLEAFSDGVIAIIITIMVLDLKVPADAAPSALRPLLPVFLAYALSFLLVAIYWVNHHHLVHLVKYVDGPMLWLNANLLFWMSLIPFTTAYLGLHHATRASTAMYAAVQLACCLSFYVLRAAIFRPHRNDPRMEELCRSFARKNRLAAAIYVAAMGAAFLNAAVSLALILLPAAMYFLPDGRIEARETGPHRPAE